MTLTFDLNLNCFKSKFLYIFIIIKLALNNISNINSNKVHTRSRHLLKDEYLEKQSFYSYFLLKTLFFFDQHIRVKKILIFFFNRCF